MKKLNDDNAGSFLSNVRENSGRIDIIVRGRKKIKWGLKLCINIILNRLKKEYLGRYREWIYCNEKDNLKEIKRVVIPKCA